MSRGGIQVNHASCIIHELLPESGDIHLSKVNFLAYEAGDLVFNSKPSVMSLSLNSKPISFKEEGVVIRFEHQNNSMVRLVFFQK